jgi:uncharacterized protein
MLAVGAIVAAGAAIQASVGIGFGILAAPLLVILAPELVPGPILVLGLVLALMTTTREFRDVDLRELGLALVGRFAGTVAAGGVIALLPMAAFASVFALMLLAAIGLSLTRWRLLPTPRNLMVAGVLSGFMGTITSVGAPPMAMVYQNMPGPKVRATLGAFLTLGAALSLITLSLVGRFNTAQAMSVLWLFPPVIVGFFLSRYFTRHVDKSRRAVKVAVLGISGIAALMLLLKPFL